MDSEGWSSWCLEFGSPHYKTWQTTKKREIPSYVLKDDLLLQCTQKTYKVNITKKRCTFFNGHWGSGKPLVLLRVQKDKQEVVQDPFVFFFGLLVSSAHGEFFVG